MYNISGSYIPYNDSGPVKPTILTGSTGMNTLSIDSYRQGVEIRNSIDLYRVTQPKLFCGVINKFGEINHIFDSQTYGQSMDSIEFEGNIKFKELSDFNTLEYMQLGNEYQFPILFTGGQAKQIEATIEIFTIPFRLPSNEGNQIARKVGGEFLGGGNNLDTYNKDGNCTEQFIPYTSSSVFRFFLDEGQSFDGTTITGSVRREGYRTLTQTLVQPFTDQTNEYIIQQISYPSSMLSILNTLDYNTNNDIRPINCRSSTAGTVVYGPNQNKYGTDSLAFAGRIRGS